MKKKYTVAIVVALALWLAILPARAGGWAVVTLEEWPVEIRAGEAATIVFSIRQHGQSLAPGYEPIIRANHSGGASAFEVTALETKREGFYTADLIFPEAGDWSWSISYHGGPDYAQNMPDLTVAAAGTHPTAASDAGGGALQAFSYRYIVAALGGLTLFIGAGFFAVTRSRGAMAAALSGAVVIAAGLLLAPRAQAAPEVVSGAPAEAAAARVSLSEQGRFLFVAKGCIVCHTHAELREGFTGITTDIGPNFTWGTKRPLEWLQVWLKDPQAIKPGTSMPNLELKETEINALAAFLMGELDE